MAPSQPPAIGRRKQAGSKALKRRLFCYKSYSDSRVEARSWYWAFECLHKPRPSVATARLRLAVAETLLFADDGATHGSSPQRRAR